MKQVIWKVNYRKSC